MDNAYVPSLIEITRCVQEAPGTKTFCLKYPLKFNPGQFLEVSCLGIGEAPISISSSPKEDFLKITFRRVGCVTTGLFNLKENDSLGIRGPFGNGFPLTQLEGKNLLFIAGGIGLAPLRSLLKLLLSNPQAQSRRIGNAFLLYGCRTPKEILYKKEIKQWRKFIQVLLTVDRADSKWTGKVGVVTQLLDEVKFEPQNSKAFVCGPEIMMRFTTQKLIKLEMKPADIILSLERKMQCGMGKCGHCYIADKFVCKDGPVFTYAQLNSLIPTEIL